MDQQAEVMPRHIREKFAELLTMWEDHLVNSLKISRADAKFQIGAALSGTGVHSMQQAYQIMTLKGKPDVPLS